MLTHARDEEDAKRILDYWFVMGFLNQRGLEDFKKKGKEASRYKNGLKNGRVRQQKRFLETFVEFGPGDDLQTLVNAESKAVRLPFWGDFTVFVGRMRRTNCVRSIAQHVKWHGETPDEDTDEIALASLKFSRNGGYISNSLSISPLAWAMKRLSGGTADTSKERLVSDYNDDKKSIEKRINDLFEPAVEDDQQSETMPTEAIDAEMDTVSLADASIAAEAISKPSSVMTVESVADTADDGNGIKSKTKERVQVCNDVSYDLLKEVEDVVINELKIDVPETEGSYIAVYFKLCAQENDIDEDEDETSLHMDFYSEDLAAAAEGLRNNSFTEKKKKLILDYILGLYRYGGDSQETPMRFDLIKPEDKEALYRFMQEHLTVEKAPLGKWPSRFMPALMQQAAVNLATDEGAPLPVFSVNGPPGTGKTTLLKEIIVNNIVEKARLLAAYEDPDEAFDDQNFEHGGEPDHSYSQHVRKYHRLKDKKIGSYSILVASNNNTAVENITKKLPLEEELLKDIRPSGDGTDPNDAALAELTRMFTVSESRATLPRKQTIWEKYKNEDGVTKERRRDIVIEEPDIYFSRLASDLLGKDKKSAQQSGQSAFGLISAALGNRANINEVENKVISPLLEMMKKNDDVAERKKSKYPAACKEFKTQLEAVKQLRDDIEAEEHRKAIDGLNADKAVIEANIAKICAVTEEWKSKIKTQQENIAAIQSRIATLKRPFFDKWFKPSSYKKSQEEIDQASEMQKKYLQQMDEYNGYLDAEEARLAAARDGMERLEEKISIEEEKLKEFQEGKARIETDRRDKYERGFIPDRSFIEDILSPDIDISTKAQLKDPWFSDHYNREREKLFFCALQVTKEFILSSVKCRDNLKHLECLWTRRYDKKGEYVKFIDDDLQNCTAAAYETLFLLIPVVSSTFASVQRFFKNIKNTWKEDIVGTLIVDEAGQASPQTAIGALCRSGKAVIVGDPKQVEPVVVDDQDLLRQTYEDDIFRLYADKSNSVQRFADIMNPYGTYLEDDQGRPEWVGCPLLVHRRCISPMYDISNEISYNNIMRQQTAMPKAEQIDRFVDARSQWINVTGREDGKKRHFVRAQGEKVIELLEIAFSKAEYPDLFIISPFKTVVSGIKDYVNTYVNSCRNKGVESSLVRAKSSLDVWMGNNIGTVHKFQGKEAAEVIFLLGCDTSEAALGAIRWVNNNIVNVAVTRAKYRLYVIGDIQAWKNSRCVSTAKHIIDTYALESLEHELQKDVPDKGKLKSLCEQIPTQTTFPVVCKTGDGEETEDEYISSTTEVIGELNKTSIMSRNLTQGELARFGFGSMADLRKFSVEIQSNLLWGMKLYILLENVYKQTNVEMDASCCGILFCKSIELQMQECFIDALKLHFPDYQVRVIPASRTQEKQIIYMKDADAAEFTLGLYPAFIKKNEKSLGDIMSGIGYAAYDAQWWDDFKSKLFMCNNERRDCCHPRPFLWNNLEILLETMFSTTETKHHIQLKGLMFESEVGRLMKTD